MGQKKKEHWTYILSNISNYLHFQYHFHTASRQIYLVIMSSVHYEDFGSYWQIRTKIRRFGMHTNGNMCVSFFESRWLDVHSAQECVHKILKLNIAEGQEKEVGTTLNATSRSSKRFLKNMQPNFLKLSRCPSPFATGPKSSDLPCSAAGARYALCSSTVAPWRRCSIGVWLSDHVFITSTSSPTSRNSRWLKDFPWINATFVWWKTGISSVFRPLFDANRMPGSLFCRHGSLSFRKFSTYFRISGSIEIAYGVRHITCEGCIWCMVTTPSSQLVKFLQLPRLSACAAWILCTRSDKFWVLILLKDMERWF